MWPYVCIPNTQNCYYLQNTVPEAECQFELPTKSTINYKIFLKLVNSINTKIAKRIY